MLPLFFRYFQPNDKCDVDLFHKLWKMPYVYNGLIKNINSRQLNWQITPLTVALRYNWPKECIDVLIENGATLDINEVIDSTSITTECFQDILTRYCIIYKQKGNHTVLMWDLGILEQPQEPQSRVCTELGAPLGFQNSQSH